METWTRGWNHVIPKPAENEHANNTTGQPPVEITTQVEVVSLFVVWNSVYVSLRTDGEVRLKIFPLRS